ncbi:hypothetical protein BJX70DRAFT_352577 [Aspergillus crustosus]
MVMASSLKTSGGGEVMSRNSTGMVVGLLMLGCGTRVCATGWISLFGIQVSSLKMNTILARTDSWLILFELECMKARAE